MARKTILDPSAGKKSLVKRVRDFIQGPSDEELVKKVKEIGAFAPRYQNSIWNGFNNSNMSGMGFATEIPNMLRDPVISSAVNLLMTTCFQLNVDQKIFWPKSKHADIVRELEKFHIATAAQRRILTLGYNIIVWGNVPINLIYDKNDILAQYKFIGDYNSVIPIIVSGKTIGHLVGGEYHYPLEYVFAQSQYNHDLGGPLGHGYIKLGNMAYGSGAGGNVANMTGGGYKTQDESDNAYEVENEFALAPSYVANAVRPWRNIKIVEDALLLARLDQSNYFRIFTVNVGATVDSKAAIRTLNYYRSLFKKVRHVSYDSNGMAQQGGGAEFEVIIPKTNVQGGVEVTDVGGQRDITALKDLDVQYQRLFASLNLQPSQIGFGQGQSSNINMGASPEEAWEARWMRTCKSTLYSTLDAIKQIDLYYLRSLGYRVDPSDWTYGTVLQAQIDDRERNETLKIASLNLKTITDTFNTMQFAEYNKPYLIKSVLGPSIESVGIDLDTLFTPVAPATQPIPQDYKLRVEELRQIVSIAELSDGFPTSLINDLNAYIDSTDPDKKQLLLSDFNYTPHKITQAQIQSGAAYLSYPSAEVDLDSFFKRVAAIPEDLKVFKDVNIVSSIDVASQFFIPKDLDPITVKDLQDTGVSSIMKAIMLTPDSFILESREDILTMLYLKLNQSFTAIVNELFYVESK